MDKSVFGGLANFSEDDNQRMSAMAEEQQVRDSLKVYNSLVERCFKDCVNAFYRKSLTKQEETCVLRCAEKFLRLSMQVSSRFSELDQGGSPTDARVHR